MIENIIQTGKRHQLMKV